MHDFGCVLLRVQDSCNFLSTFVHATIVKIDEGWDCFGTVSTLVVFLPTLGMREQRAWD